MNRLSIGVRTLAWRSADVSDDAWDALLDYAVSHRPIRASDVFGMMIFDFPFSLVLAYIILKLIQKNSDAKKSGRCFAFGG